jgi:hypothetical protein
MIIKARQYSPTTDQLKKEKARKIAGPLKRLFYNFIFYNTSLKPSTTPFVACRS